MARRKLKRQLNLLQVVMLGTAGTIAAEIFVLTGHAVGMAGPAVVLALIVGGLMSYAVALNYCELGTAFPFAGGAMTYVREAFGNGMLSYLVGSMDCISSTFYAALSAVGFAYSLQIFIPGLPIVATALVVIAVFIVLNLFGVSQVGNAQILFGGLLLSAFVIYVVVGFVSPNGFKWVTMISGESIFIHGSTWANFSRILATIALVYNAYVGFEVIADDAEEIKNPNANLPRGILISVTLSMVIYVTVSMVAVGTVPWQELAGSETALTDSVQHFIPGWGVPMMAVAGMIATVTSVNSAMLSATREAFTLGRDGVWPRPFAKLSRFRTPHVAILIIGAISAMIAAIGVVDFLSYISSSGYLFVLFWGSLSLMRLRKQYPNISRPFRVPLYPLTVFAAGAACILIIVFAQWQAIVFGAALLGVFALVHVLGPVASRTITKRLRFFEAPKDRILVPVANPNTAKALLHIASIVAHASSDGYICVLTVTPQGLQTPEVSRKLLRNSQPMARAAFAETVELAQARNVALYAKTAVAENTGQGILDEIELHNNVQLVLAGWPGPLNPAKLAANPVKVVLQKAQTNVAVLLNRGLMSVPLKSILVPVGGGPHSRLALRMAAAIAEAEEAQVTVLRVLTKHANPGPAREQADMDEEIEDTGAMLMEIVEEALGSTPTNFHPKVIQADSIEDGVLEEASRSRSNLIVMGASQECTLETRLFGSVDDWVADRAPCSLLFVRRHEPIAISWLRYQIKRIEGEYHPNGAKPH